MEKRAPVWKSHSFDFEICVCPGLVNLLESIGHLIINHHIPLGSLAPLSLWSSWPIVLRYNNGVSSRKRRKQEIMHTCLPFPVPAPHVSWVHVFINKTQSPKRGTKWMNHPRLKKEMAKECVRGMFGTGFEVGPLTLWNILLMV